MIQSITAESVKHFIAHYHWFSVPLGPLLEVTSHPLNVRFTLCYRPLGGDERLMVSPETPDMSVVVPARMHAQYALKSREHVSTGSRVHFRSYDILAADRTMPM